MRVLVATVQVPFVRGGGEILAEGLVSALRSHGHEAELLTAPFRFGPETALRESIAHWEGHTLDHFDSGPIDRVVYLKFPCYYASHGASRVWLLHQHRAYYELWSGDGEGGRGDEAKSALRDWVVAADTSALGRVGHRYTISKRVSARLMAFNGLSSAPIYHPPHDHDQLYCAASEPYVFYPSRLESLKRQALLVDAMSKVRAPVVAIIAGEGGQAASIQARIDALGIGDRVRLIGRIDDATKRVLYANCRAVVFPPFDEDYGYVTLEAMLSGKPVITCTDSGGPLEFVRDGINGWVVPPDATALADAIQVTADHPRRAVDAGAAGRAVYRSMNIGWEGVVSTLLA